MNPFKAAKSANEFISILRKELEKLRGRKFKYWKVIEPTWVDVHGQKVVFTVVADRVKLCRFRGDTHNYVSWYQIASGDCAFDFPKGTKLHAFAGFPMLKGSSGGSVGDNLFRETAHIALKYLPHIAKLANKNQKIYLGRNEVLCADVQLRALAAQHAELGVKVSERRDHVLQEYMIKQKIVSPLTGELLSAEGMQMFERGGWYA